MHILLIYPVKPRLTYGFIPGPYGLETLKTYLEDLAVQCEIINPFLHFDPHKHLLEAIRSDTILIGVSIRNLDDALTVWDPNIADGEVQTESCIEDVKQVISWCYTFAPDVPIILGGATFSHMPIQLLDYLEVDTGLVGDSEYDFAILVKRMVKGRFKFNDIIQKLPNAVLRNSNKNIRLSQLPNSSLRIPIVQREEIYFNFRPEAAVRTFSGCPLSCSHCIEHVGKRKVSKSALKVVVDEINGVVTRYPKIKRIFFADSELNLAGEQRTANLIQTIRQHEFLRDIPLVGYFNPRPLSFKFLHNLANANCEIRLTVDHISNSILARNGKNFRLHHLHDLVRYFYDLQLELSFCLLLGQPGETKATVDEVLKFIESIPEAILGPIYFSPGVRVYPGTPLERGLKDGTINSLWLAGEVSKKDPFIRPVVYCESWRPFELFEYVMSRSGGRIKPMNSYLQGMSINEKNLLDQEFANFHIGLVELGEEESAAWKAWSSIRTAPTFLSFQQKIDFLWIRGRLALQSGDPLKAIEDWIKLRSLFVQHQISGQTISKLEHNIEVARQIAQNSGS